VAARPLAAKAFRPLESCFFWCVGFDLLVLGFDFNLEPPCAMLCTLYEMSNNVIPRSARCGCLFEHLVECFETRGDDRPGRDARMLDEMLEPRVLVVDEEENEGRGRGLLSVLGPSTLDTSIQNNIGVELDK